MLPLARKINHQYEMNYIYDFCFPVSFTMILSSLAVVYINNEATLAEGAATMAEAYQYFDTTNASALSAVLRLCTCSGTSW